MKTFLLILLFFPLLTRAQNTAITPEMKKAMKEGRRRTLLLTREATIRYELGLKISRDKISDFGNFERNDTSYYDDRNIFRISQAKYGDLNGYFIYYYHDKTIYSISKYEDGELIDTAKTFYSDGTLKSMTSYKDSLYSIESSFYPGGKIASVKKFKKETEIVENGNTDTRPEPVESKYFDLQGKEISEAEHNKILEDFSKTK